MAQARRRWTRVLGAAVALTAGGIGLGACTTTPVPVVVAGLDRQGTFVVGSVDCTWGLEDFDGMAVAFEDDVLGGRVWSVRRPDAAGSDYSDPVRSIQPPPPDPRVLDDVTLVAVGDANAPGWVSRSSLTEPVPELGQARVSFERDYEPTLSLTIDLGGPPDRFSASVDGQVVQDLSSADLARRIEDVCDEAQAFSGGTFWAVSGGTLGAVLLGAVVIGLLTVRQWRRAGAAVARARDRTTTTTT